MSTSIDKTTLDGCAASSEVTVDRSKNSAVVKPFTQSICYVNSAGLPKSGFLLTAQIQQSDGTIVNVQTFSDEQGAVIVPAPVILPDSACLQASLQSVVQAPLCDQITSLLTSLSVSVPVATDELIVNQGGICKKVTLSALLADKYANNTAVSYNAATGVLTITERDETGALLTPLSVTIGGTVDINESSQANNSTVVYGPGETVPGELTPLALGIFKIFTPTPVTLPVCPCVKTSKVSTDQGSGHITITDSMLQAACSASVTGPSPTIAYKSHNFDLAGTTTSIFDGGNATGQGQWVVPIPAAAAPDRWMIGQFHFKDVFGRVGAWNVNQIAITGASDVSVLNTSQFFVNPGPSSYAYNVLVKSSGIAGSLTLTANLASPPGLGTASVMWHEFDANFISAAQIGVKETKSIADSLVTSEGCFGINLYGRPYISTRGATIPTASSSMTLVTARHIYALGGGVLNAPATNEDQTFINPCEVVTAGYAALPPVAGAPTGNYIQKSATYVCPTHFAGILNPASGANMWLPEDGVSDDNGFVVSYFELLPKPAVVGSPIVLALNRSASVQNLECPECPGPMNTEAYLNPGSLEYSIVGNPLLKLKVTYGGSSVIMGVGGQSASALPGGIASGPTIAQGASATYTASVEIVCPPSGYVSNPANNIIVSNFSLTARAYV